MFYCVHSEEGVATEHFVSAFTGEHDLDSCIADGFAKQVFGNTMPDSYFEAIATKMAHSYSTSLAYRVLEDA